eukprot:Tbor_TRINITY_DN5665_c1_g4::TRINITY_DN5665_c1_g4_i2::g.9442::m.9442
MFLGKLAIIMGPDMMGARFTAAFDELQASYVQQGFTISPSPVAPTPQPAPQPAPPPAPQAHRVSEIPSSPSPRRQESSTVFQQHVREIDVSLSTRIVGYSYSSIYAAHPGRSIFRSNDEDIKHEICGCEEDRRMLAIFPQYCFQATDRTFMISALRALVRLGRQRKDGVEDFVKTIREHTITLLRSQNPVPHVLLVNTFLSAVRNVNPLVYISALEIAAFIVREGVDGWEELGKLITARCSGSPEKNQAPFIVKGWAVHPGSKKNEKGAYAKKS